MRKSLWARLQGEQEDSSKAAIEKLACYNFFHARGFCFSKVNVLTYRVYRVYVYV